MLSLKKITKDYVTGDETVNALKGVDIEFRENEFVSILGPSGCGKTTLLNIVGGLDRYTSGDLVINGKSTKEYRDSNWDTYRNHSIGFVFQSYNLIPHQTVLSNVELALTLSGVSKTERKQRAIEVLTKVGLSDQINKKPNQMSGGQMQRVAIARALINDPDILLADEPTGALDTATSLQIMDILKDISKDKLIIMVTHNPDLAEEYSSRTIKLLDGNVIDDSNPYTANVVEPIKHEEKQTADKKKGKKTSMSFMTALSLSMNNLMTKKARTLLTSFAGSIGIIGIALILSLSNGVQTYIDNVQEDTLSQYPLTIDEQTTNLTSMMTTMAEVQEPQENRAKNKIYSGNKMTKMLNVMLSESTKNNLTEFKKYLDGNTEIDDYTTDIKYSYTTPLNIYKAETDDGAVQVNPPQIYQALGMGSQMSEMEQYSSMSSSMGGTGNTWAEILDNDEILESQYDVIAGKLPEKYDEIVVVVNEYNEIDDYSLYSLGLKDVNELPEMMRKIMNMETIDDTVLEYTYDDILNLRYKLILNTDYYKKYGSRWVDMSDDDAYMKTIVENGIELKVVGILRPNEDASASSITGTVGYRSDLMETLINKINDEEIVKQQLTDPDTDIFTGLKFEDDTQNEEKPEQTREEMLAILGYDSLSDEEKAQIDMLPDEQLASIVASAIEAQENPKTREDMLAMIDYESLSDEEKAQIDALDDASLGAMIQMMAPENDKYADPDKPETTYDQNMSLLGVAALETPSSINIYPKDFESKEKVEDIIQAYNEKVTADGHEEDAIEYTDLVGLMMNSVSAIINAISYVLIAFVAISLVVSSIMIGIITYISVLERTKEIGILRSIGASKMDISRVFNAETIIVGFVAGSLGIIISYLLTIPINAIISHLTTAPVRAIIPAAGAIILIVISVLLTFIAGLFPAKVAAKKDPVVALRTD